MRFVLAGYYKEDRPVVLALEGFILETCEICKTKSFTD